METWLPVVGFEGRYEVSDQGRIKSLHNRWGREAILKPNRVGPTLDRLQIGLTDERGRRMRYVHVLVAEAFIGPKPPGQETRHINGIPTDCRAANLCYGTHGQNTLDSVGHGTHNMARKTHCKHGHEFTEENTYIWVRPSTGRQERQCNICRAAATARANRRR